MYNVSSLIKQRCGPNSRPSTDEVASKHKLSGRVSIKELVVFPKLLQIIGNFCNSSTAGSQSAIVVVQLNCDIFSSVVSCINIVLLACLDDLRSYIVTFLLY